MLVSRGGWRGYLALDFRMRLIIYEDCICACATSGGKVMAGWLYCQIFRGYYRGT